MKQPVGFGVIPKLVVNETQRLPYEPQGVGMKLHVVLVRVDEHADEIDRVELEHVPALHHDTAVLDTEIAGGAEPRARSPA